MANVIEKVESITKSLKTFGISDDSSNELLWDLSSTFALSINEELNEREIEWCKLSPFDNNLDLHTRIAASAILVKLSLEQNSFRAYTEEKISEIIRCPTHYTSNDLKVLPVLIFNWEIKIKLPSELLVFMNSCLSACCSQMNDFPAEVSMKTLCILMNDSNLKTNSEYCNCLENGIISLFNKLCIGLCDVKDSETRIKLIQNLFYTLISTVKWLLDEISVTESRTKLLYSTLNILKTTIFSLSLNSLALYENLDVTSMMLSVVLKAFDVDSKSANTSFAKEVHVYFIQSECIFDLLLHYLLSEDAFVRKRGSFILEALLSVIDKEVKPIKGKKIEKDGFQKKRFWLQDFVDVYHQVEGCSSIHLIEQTWPIFDFLMRKIYELDSKPSNKTKESESLTHFLPEIEFNWGVVLINCLITSKSPTVKKAIVHRILTNAVPLLPTLPVCTWVCRTLIRHLDSAIYFNGIGHKSCYNSSGKEDCSALDASRFTSEQFITHPGLLLPNFLREYYTALCGQDDIELVKLFFVELLEIVAESTDLVLLQTRTGKTADKISPGLSSISAIRWLLQAFVQTEGKMNSLYSCKPEVRCFTLDHLVMIQAMIADKMLCLNDVVWTQILSGLYPWVLSRVVINELSQVDLCLVLKSILSISSFQIGLAKCLKLGRLNLLTVINEIISLITDTDGLFEVFCYHLVDTEKKINYQGCVLLGEVYSLCKLLNSNCLGVQFLAAKFLDCRTFWANCGWMDNSINSAHIWFLSGVVKSSFIINSLENSISFIRNIDSIEASNVDLLSKLLLDVATSNGGEVSGVEELVILSNLYAFLCIGPLSGKEVTEESINQCLSIVQKCVSTIAFEKVSILAKVLLFKVSSSVLVSMGSILKLAKHSLVSASISDRIMGTLKILLELQDVSSVQHLQFSELYKNNNQMCSTLQIDAYLHYCEPFSRYIGVFMQERWLCIKGCIELLKLQNHGIFNGAQSIDYNLKIMDILIAQIESCSSSISETILYCAEYLCMWFLKDPSTRVNTIFCDKLTQVVNLVWMNCQSESSSMNMFLFKQFINFLFGPEIFPVLGLSDVVREILDQILVIGHHFRPYVMQYLVGQIIATVKTNNELCIPLFPYFESFILYKEPVLNDQTLCDAMSVSTSDNSLVRLLVLGYLESLLVQISTNSNEFSSSFLTDFSESFKEMYLSLLCMNTKPDYINAAMIGSDKFGAKLRCWQALGVLSLYIDESVIISDAVDYGKCGELSHPSKADGIVKSVLSILFDVLKQNCAHSIRVYMEVVGGVLMLRFAKHVLPYLYQALQEFNCQQQTLSSYFVILGYAVIRKNVVIDDSLCSKRFDHLPFEEYEEVISYIMPWLTCAGGLPRSIAQLILFEMIPIVLSTAKTELSHHGYLKRIFEYLSTNKDAKKILAKQTTFFTRIPLEMRCSLKGFVKTTPVDGSGEKVSLHLLEILVDFMKTEYGTIEDAVIPQNNADIRADGEILMQTKRTPFDELQIQISQEVRSRRNNAAGTCRQPVIVCATLVDRIANIAGIARTCEIFAVESFTISSLLLMNTEEFKAVAVSCEGWLPVTEVTEVNLLTFITDCKRKGYAIVGLEQTDGSVNLSSSSVQKLLPNRCVLLLGKEKEGIPAYLLCHVDVCIEIPQYGVIRSLNVHVSAALALWEITKNNMSTMTKENM